MLFCVTSIKNNCYIQEWMENFLWPAIYDEKIIPLKEFLRFYLCWIGVFIKNNVLQWNVFVLFLFRLFLFYRWAIIYFCYMRPIIHYFYLLDKYFMTHQFLIYQKVKYWMFYGVASYFTFHSITVKVPDFCIDPVVFMDVENEIVEARSLTRLLRSISP